MICDKSYSEALNNRINGVPPALDAKARCKNHCVFVVSSERSQTLRHFSTIGRLGCTNLDGVFHVLG